MATASGKPNALAQNKKPNRKIPRPQQRGLKDMATELALTHIPVGTLLHDWPTVLGRITAGERIHITRNGKVVAVLAPPDASEAVLDELASTGRIEPDWRARQATLRKALSQVPARSEPAGDPLGSAAIIADREDTDR